LALIVSMASLGWTIYDDLKNDHAAVAQDQTKEIDWLSAERRAQPLNPKLSGGRRTSRRSASIDHRRGRRIDRAQPVVMSVTRCARYRGTGFLAVVIIGHVPVMPRRWLWRNPVEPDPSVLREARI
jgi:hypothetical protein